MPFSFSSSFAGVSNSATYKNLSKMLLHILTNLPIIHDKNPVVIFDGIQSMCDCYNSGILKLKNSNIALNNSVTSRLRTFCIFAS